MKRLVWAVIGLAAGCAPEYVYRPAANATARIEGRGAALYQLPPERPAGDVRIASFGIAPVGEGESERSTMHVRMIVSNASDQPWKVDSREQLANVRGAGPVAAVYARADRPGLPELTIAPGDKLTLDLFYPLPAGSERARTIPEFDVSWKVQTNARLVAARTPFERLRVEPYYYGPYYAGPGWAYSRAYGRYTWADPLWPPGVIGAPGWYW
jgi:hypothetical protein